MPPKLREITGEWVGTYTCAQGETGLTLIVEPSGRTEFRFYALPANVAARSGSFEMRASVDGPQPEFHQVRWLNRPGDYLMVDLRATDKTPDTMRGVVFGNGCTTFKVNRNQS